MKFWSKILQKLFEWKNPVCLVLRRVGITYWTTLDRDLAGVVRIAQFTFHTPWFVHIPQKPAKFGATKQYLVLPLNVCVGGDMALCPPIMRMEIFRQRTFFLYFCQNWHEWVCSQCFPAALWSNPYTHAPAFSWEILTVRKHGLVMCV